MRRILITITVGLAMLVAAFTFGSVGFSADVDAITNHEVCPVWPCGD